MMKQILALAIPLLALDSALTQNSPAPENTAALSSLWKASLEAESDKNYDEAIKEVSSFYQQGGDRFMAYLRSETTPIMKSTSLAAQRIRQRAGRAAGVKSHIPI